MIAIKKKEQKQDMITDKRHHAKVIYRSYKEID